jgi:hypothetical protein
MGIRTSSGDVNINKMLAPTISMLLLKASLARDRRSMEYLPLRMASGTKRNTRREENKKDGETMVLAIRDLIPERTFPRGRSPANVSDGILWGIRNVGADPWGNRGTISSMSSEGMASAELDDLSEVQGASLTIVLRICPGLEFTILSTWPQESSYIVTGRSERSLSKHSANNMPNPANP